MTYELLVVASYRLLPHSPEWFAKRARGIIVAVPGNIERNVRGRTFHRITILHPGALGYLDRRELDYVRVTEDCIRLEA